MLIKFFKIGCEKFIVLIIWLGFVLYYIIGIGVLIKFFCFSGIYLDRFNLFDVFQCDICFEIKYCLGGELEFRGDCFLGYYCLSGIRVVEQFLCFNGIYNFDYVKVRVEECRYCI